MKSALRYDKNGRARDERGRFVSAKVERWVTWAETGQVATETIRGREVYRGPDGTLLPAKYAALQAEERVFVGRGKNRREVHPGDARPEAARNPATTSEAVSMELWMQGAPRLALDLGANDEDQFVKWAGKFYRIRPENAGGLSDLFRMLNDRYISIFLPFMNSPQFRTPITETPRGMLYDLDDLELMDEEIEEEMGIEAPVKQFREFVRTSASQLLKHHAKKKEAKSSRKRGKRTAKRGTNSKKRK